MVRKEKDNVDAGDGWEQCPEGSFAHLSKQLKRKQTRREFLRAGGVVALLAAAGGGVLLWQGMKSTRSSLPGRLYCNDVARRIGRYRSGSGLDDEMRRRVREHVAGCTYCQRRYSDILDS